MSGTMPDAFCQHISVTTQHYTLAWFFLDRTFFHGNRTRFFEVEKGFSCTLSCTNSFQPFCKSGYYVIREIVKPDEHGIFLKFWHWVQILDETVVNKSVWGFAGLGRCWFFRIQSAEKVMKIRFFLLLQTISLSSSRNSCSLSYLIFSASAMVFLFCSLSFWSQGFSQI